jgi:hypothetical protein
MGNAPTIRILPTVPDLRNDFCTSKVFALCSRTALREATSGINIQLLDVNAFC